MSVSMGSTATKKYEYVAPASPPNLKECASFTINFPNRKFIHVGLDEAQNKLILIITPARHIIISVVLFQRILSIMGHILSFMFDPPKYKKIIFLSTEEATLSSMVYRGQNVLVMESKTQNGCRVLLNCEDLMRLINLELEIMQRVDNIRIYPISMEPISSNVNPQQTYSPPSYLPASPSFPPHVKEEIGVDHNDGPFGPQYIIPSIGEEDYNIGQYLKY